MTPARDFVAPDDPGSRPVRQRRTVRVLLVDSHERMLLLHDSDPGIAGRQWWFTPGGGVDPGESEVDAVVRELAEETGLRITPEQVLGPVAHRHVVHGYSDQVVEQDDTFYAVRTPGFDLDPAGRTEEEQVTLLGHHWWSHTELVGTTQEVWPVALTDLWAALGSPGAWPLDLPDVEESSRPV